MLSVCFADKLEHTEMDSSDTDCRFQWFIKRTVHFRKMMVTTSEGYYSHFENIQQTLEWITGLYLKLISRFEKGFRSLDRDLFQAFIEWGKSAEE